jgi:8-oxo-dGTP pyrophosphatase MutT (NUDIX family)
MKNDDKILYSSDHLNMVERSGMVGVIPNFSNVVILPYIADKEGLPLLIGVLKEYNFFREGGYSISPITGSSDEEDPNFLETAKRELLEESGYDASDSDRWYFLGNAISSKFVDHEQPCFAVDVTDIKRQEPQTDGSEQESLSSFVFIPANDVVKCKDVFIPALFLKLFKFVLGKDINNSDSEDLFKPKGFNITL